MCVALRLTIYGFAVSALSGALSCSDTGARQHTIDADENRRDGAAEETSGAAIATQQVTVGELVFDVRVAGNESGEPVILLHGFPETSYEWRHQLKALAEAGYRAIAPDQRGYSPGARPSAVDDYSVFKLSKDVVDIADGLGVSRFHLVGHDWGGGVGWAVAKIYADRVLTYTSVSVPHPDAFQHELSDSASCQYQASSYFDVFTRPDAANLFLDNDAGVLHATYAGVSPDDIAVYVKALGNRAAMTAALDWYTANITDRKFNVPGLGPVSVPTLLVWGDQDQFFCRQTIELSKNYMEGPYQFEELPGVNHWLPENASERLNALLLEHVGRAR